jgi:hypothetical protein
VGGAEVGDIEGGVVWAVLGRVVDGLAQFLGTLAAPEGPHNPLFQRRTRLQEQVSENLEGEDFFRRMEILYSPPGFPLMIP